MITSSFTEILKNRKKQVVSIGELGIMKENNDS